MRQEGRQALGARLMHRFGAVTAARAVALVATLVQLPLLTSSLTPTQYALVAAAIASGTFVSFASVEPAVLAFQRFSGSTSQREGYARAQAQLLVGMTAAVGVVGVGAAVGALAICFAAAGWGVSLAWLRLVSTAWLMWDEPWKYTKCMGASTVVRTAALCGMVWAGVRPEVAVGAAGILSAVAVVLLRPRLKGARAPLRAPHRWLGTSLAVSSLAVGLLQGIDKVLLPVVTSGESAGKYAAMSNLSAYSLGALFGIVGVTVFSPMLRLWEAGDRLTAVRHLRTATTGALGLSVLASALVLLGGQHLAVYVVGEEYVDASVLAALLVGAGLLACGQFNAYLYQFRLDTAALQARSWLGAVVAIGLLLLGGSFAGERGAAAGMVIGLAVYAAGLQLGNRADWTAIAATGIVAAFGVAQVLIRADVPAGVVGMFLSAALLAVAVHSAMPAAWPSKRVASPERS